MKLFNLCHFVAAMLATAPMVVAVDPPDVLRNGSPESVGMLPEPLKAMESNLTRFTESRNWGSPSHNQNVPIEPGGATLVARHGVIVSNFAFGKRNRWASVHGTEATVLPQDKQEDANVDTIYDLASLTKLFTTVAALRCIDKQLFTLESKVADGLPAFAVNDKGNITVLQLLTHTSGLPPDPAVGLWSPQFPTYESKIENILNSSLDNAPGSKFVYSDLNFMTLMLLVEQVTEMRLDEAIHEYTSMLGMKDTYFNRGNIEGDKLPTYRRTATEEFQAAVVGKCKVPKRPQPVRGTVHDENAFGLGGVSGHAGLFSTVGDTARFCQMILNNGTYDGKRVLSPRAVDLIFTDFNGAKFGSSHGVGFELNQEYTAGPMANPLAASHTGFTGTSLVIDRASDTFWVHFSNRVHPSRNWSSNNVIRETVGAWVATSLGRDVLFP